ncbi:MAG: site-specific integrase [Acidobacteriota bacterium]|nr:site-specific integrase [Acidobacteriota bacterium]
MTGRRHFGTVRQRSSGRWQATYRHEGQRISAGVFRTKADALASLSVIESDMLRGVWVDPLVGKLTLERYASEWLERRPDLAVRTRDLYAHVLGRHVLPSLGRATIAGLTPSKIRGWHAALAEVHPATAAKAYRLLSSIMRTAVTDGLITTNPCKVKGAGQEHSAERPVASAVEVEALRLAMPVHLRVVVALAAWCQLRRGEILGLRRSDVDLLHCALHIRRSRTFTMDGRSVEKEPKTRAGSRVIAVPPPVMEIIAEHLEQFTDPVPDSLLVTGRNGEPLSRDALQGAWETARAHVGRRDLRLHDLRHSGLTIAAATGATTVELMHRAGHASSAAAMRYQHAVRDRDRILAEALGELVERSVASIPNQVEVAPGERDPRSRGIV